MNLSNNVRLWENNGHTPDEMHERYEKTNLTPLPEIPFGFTESNDPCPCGSGKKYKNFCLGKDKRQ